MRERVREVGGRGQIEKKTRKKKNKKRENGKEAWGVRVEDKDLDYQRREENGRQ